MSRLKSSPIWITLRRTATLARECDVGDRAAALTYYAVLSLFPGLALLVSILGVLGTEGTVNSLLDVVDELGPGGAVKTLREPVVQIAGGRGGAGIALVVSLAGTLWTASGFLGALRRAANAIRGTAEKRRAYLSVPRRLGVTLAIVLLAALVMSAVLLTGPLAGAVARAAGVDGALAAWSVVRWPTLFLAAVAAIVTLYRAEAGAGRSVSELVPASVVATLLWLVASVGFTLYLSNLGSYDATYGSLGAAIAFLVWTWLSNAALLAGIAFDEVSRAGPAEAA